MSSNWSPKRKSNKPSTGLKGPPKGPALPGSYCRGVNFGDYVPLIEKVADFGTIRKDWTAQIDYLHINLVDSCKSIKLPFVGNIFELVDLLNEFEMRAVIKKHAVFVAEVTKKAKSTPEWHGKMKAAHAELLELQLTSLEVRVNGRVTHCCCLNMLELARAPVNMYEAEQMVIAMAESKKLQAQLEEEFLRRQKEGDRVWELKKNGGIEKEKIVEKQKIVEEKKTVEENKTAEEKKNVEKKNIVMIDLTGDSDDEVVAVPRKENGGKVPATPKTSLKRTNDQVENPSKHEISTPSTDTVEPPHKKQRIPTPPTETVETQAPHFPSEQEYKQLQKDFPILCKIVDNEVLFIPQRILLIIKDARWTSGFKNYGLTYYHPEPNVGYFLLFPSTKKGREGAWRYKRDRDGTKVRDEQYTLSFQWIPSKYSRIERKNELKKLHEERKIERAKAEDVELQGQADKDLHKD